MCAFCAAQPLLPTKIAVSSWRYTVAPGHVQEALVAVVCSQMPAARELICFLS